MRGRYFVTNMGTVRGIMFSSVEYVHSSGAGQHGARDYLLFWPVSYGTRSILEMCSIALVPCSIHFVDSVPSTS